MAAEAFLHIAKNLPVASYHRLPQAAACYRPDGPTDPARRAASHDDLLTLPDHVVGEIINGKLSRVAATRVTSCVCVDGARRRPGRAFSRRPRVAVDWWIFDEADAPAR